MPRSHPARGRTALLITIALGVVLAAGSSVAQAAPPPPDPVAAAHEREAGRALAKAKDAIDGTSAGPSRDVTLALRDVARTLRYLDGPDRVAARALLARPASDKIKCNATVCIHWSSSQIDPTDTNANGIPDYVDTTLTTVAQVRETYQAAGYRTPKSDVSSATNGGGSGFDVYLDDVGDSYYGYCTVDDDGIPPVGAPQNTWAYCVLDDDFSPAQFPTNTPLENLQVTAAHEYFHAVQFAYDFDEDRWLLEATATWAEDELYDAVNDNVQYLPSGPIGQPGVPMDTALTSSLHEYGSWIFFRYLTERYPAETGGLPTLVRRIWAAAGTAPGDGDQYSLEAVGTALAEQGTTLPKAFASFSDVNLRSRSFYNEGVANSYPSAQPLVKTTLSPTTYTTGKRTITMDHLTSATVRLTPNKTTSTWDLKLTVDMDHSRPGAGAIVTTTLDSGATTVASITLDSSGAGTRTVPFAATGVRYIDLTLVNFGGRYTCDQGTNLACHGTSKDDDGAEKYTATATK